MYTVFHLEHKLIVMFQFLSILICLFFVLFLITPILNSNGLIVSNTDDNYFLKCNGIKIETKIKIFVRSFSIPIESNNDHKLLHNLCSISLRKPKIILDYSSMTLKECYSWLMCVLKHRRLGKYSIGHRVKKFVRKKNIFTLNFQKSVNYDIYMNHLLSIIELIPKYLDYGIDLVYAFLKYGKIMKDISNISEIIIKKG